MKAHYRDVAITEIDEQKLLIVACDSCGAIGEKPLDAVKIDNHLVGQFTTRVTMLELMSVGAIPKIVSVSISAEPNPTGEQIIEGVKSELNTIPNESIELVISTEKNVPTKQTGLGISVSGICDKDRLRLNVSSKGDYVYCLGIPKVGNEVTSADDPEIVQLLDLQKLIAIKDIKELLPIGSSGIKNEMDRLSADTDFKFAALDSMIDLEKSAGPSTCLVFTCQNELVQSPVETRPFFKVGHLIAK